MKTNYIYYQNSIKLSEFYPKTILITILLCLGISLKSQTVIRFDSLSEINRNYSKQDFKKVKLLIKVAEGYSQINPKEGIKTSHEAFNLATKLQNVEITSEIKYVCGLNHLSLQEGELAIRQFTEGLEICKKFNLKKVKADNLWGIAEVERTFGNKKIEVEQKYIESIKIYSEFNDNIGIAKCKKGLALFYLQQGKDSLAQTHNLESWKKNQKHNLLLGLANNYQVDGLIALKQNKPIQAIEQFKKALDINRKYGQRLSESANLTSIGVAYKLLNNYPEAIAYFQNAMRIDESTGNQLGLAKNLFEIGSVYGNLNNMPKVMEYNNRARTIFETSKNSIGLADVYGNLGNVFMYTQQYDSAIYYYKLAIPIYEKVGNKNMIGANYIRIGNTLDELNDTLQALSYFEKAAQIGLETNDLKLLIQSNNSLAFANNRLKQYRKSIDYAKKAYHLADSLHIDISKRVALSNLSKSYELLGQYDSAYFYFMAYAKVKDKILNSEKKDEILRKELQYEYSKKEAVSNEILKRQATEISLKQKEIALIQQQKDVAQLQRLKTLAELQQQQLEKDKQNKQLTILKQDKQIQQVIIESQEKKQAIQQLEIQAKSVQQKYYLVGIILVLLLSFFVFRNYHNQVKSNQLISAEKKKSDDLLLNILPEEVAKELKENGKAKARNYENVSVLFTDFINFTGISEQLNPEELVDEIDICFRKFDAIMEKHGLEKIKTIGDAYLAVCGLPNSNENHATCAIEAAKEIISSMESSLFGIRIGIHSGPVVAGIVGSKKYAYDIWGDTVNTAARMEQNSLSGKINISQSTYHLVQTKIACEYRGKIQAKNKGEIDMYFVV